MENREYLVVESRFYSGAVQDMASSGMQKGRFDTKGTFACIALVFACANKDAFDFSAQRNASDIGALLLVININRSMQGLLAHVNSAPPEGRAQPTADDTKPLCQSPVNTVSQKIIRPSIINMKRYA